MLISSAAAAAGAVARRLDELSLRRDRSAGGSLRCFTTDDPVRFAELGQRFAGRPLGEVESVGTDELETLLEGGAK